MAVDLGRISGVLAASSPDWFGCSATYESQPRPRVRESVNVVRDYLV
jgi:hypothetical protein